MDTPQQPGQAPAPAPQPTPAPAPEVQPQPVQVQSDPSLAPQSSEQPKSNTTLWILLGIFLALLVGGGIWYFMFASK